MSAASRVIKNTGYLYLKMAITVFISLWTTRIVLNSLGALDFGTYNIVGGAIAMLGFLNSTMTSATQRFMNYAEGRGDKEHQKSIFNVSILLHYGVAILFCLLLLLAAYPLFHGVLTIRPDRLYAHALVLHPVRGYGIGEYGLHSVRLPNPRISLPFSPPARIPPSARSSTGGSAGLSPLHLQK